MKQGKTSRTERNMVPVGCGCPFIMSALGLSEFQAALAPQRIPAQHLLKTKTKAIKQKPSATNKMTTIFWSNKINYHHLVWFQIIGQMHHLNQHQEAPYFNYG